MSQIFKLKYTKKTIKFEKTVLKLNNLQTRSIVQTKIQETPSIPLIKCYFNKVNQQIINCPTDHKKNDVLSELNRRFGMPLYIPAISLLLSFLIISRGENKRKNFYKYFYFSLAFVSLIMAEILVRYSGKSLTYSYLYYLTPITAIPIFYFILLKKFHDENLKKNK